MNLVINEDGIADIIAKALEEKGIEFEEVILDFDGEEIIAIVEVE